MFLLAPVPAPLRGAVRRIAAYDERSAGPVRRRQAPTSTVTLVLGLGEPLRVEGAAVGSFVAGLDDTSSLTEFRGHQAGVQVDLSPTGALRLLGMPLRTLGTLRPLEELHDGPPAGAVLAGLPGRLAEIATWPGRLEAVVAALTELLTDGAASPDPEVEHAWRRLAGRGGRVPVGILADEVGWSRRHLTRRFSDQIGLAPTTLARVLRFRRAADLLVPPPGRVPRPAMRIADVAASCGFADHSHLDREFHALAGCSPRAYVAGWATVRVDPDAPAQVERAGR